MKLNIKIFSIFISIIIFIFFSWFLSNDIFSGDDIPTLSAWISEGGKFNLDGILTALITHFTGRDLPLLLHINPHTFSMTIGAYIRAFNVVLLCITMSSFMFIGREKQIYFPFILFFSAIYFCIASSNVEFDWFNPNNIPIYDSNGTFILLTEYSQHFGQLVNFILGLSFLYFIISHFAKNNLPKKENKVLISIFAFITAMSSLFVNIICGFVFCCIIFYLAISVIKEKNYNKDDVKLLVIPFISYFTGSIVFYFYPGYFKYFSLNTDFIGFAKILFNNFIVNNSFEFALILILSSVLYFLAAKKSTYIKRIIFTVSTVIIGSIIYFSLFSSLNTYIAMFLTESQVLFRLLLMTMIFTLFGACLKEHYSEPKELKILSVSFILILISYAAVQLPFTVSTINIWRNTNEETKNTVYCLEKMYRFYSLKGKTALLPDDSLMKIFKISVFLNDKNIDTDENITNRTFFKHSAFTDGYYKTFYKNSPIVSYKFIDRKKALKIFFEEGGMINENEMNHLNFQKLYDDKFVLNRSLEKSKYDN